EKAGILKIVAQEGDTLEIGALVATIEEGSAPSGTKSDSNKVENKPDSSASDVRATTDKPTAQANSAETYASGTASPAAAKILREKGIDASTLTGTGKDGRITKEDAEKATPQAKVQGTGKPTQAEAPKAASTTGARNERREKMSALRKTVAKRLVSVKNETAMLTTFNEVNMQPIMDLRAKYKDSFKEKHGVGLGYMSFFTKAVCTALKEWPAVNASIEENEVVYSDFVDVSIAVSAPKGLVVPVIRNAESLSLHEIEKEVVNLATKA